MTPAETVVAAIRLLRNRGMKYEEIKDRMGFSGRSAIGYYLNGRERKDGSVGPPEPTAETYERARTVLGLDLVRPAAPEHGIPAGEGIAVYGRVAAGSITPAVEDRRELSGRNAPWEQSIYRKLTRGDVRFLEVGGDSMEPDYPDGCLLACAEPRRELPLPDLTPVVARVHDEVTFKLFRMGRDRKGTPEVELIPINRTFALQRHDPGDVVVDYVVLGFVNPWRHGLRTDSERPMILREKGR